MPSRITSHTTGPGFEATFKNGVLDIPDQQGSYLISTGCGAGKTEGIKELIGLKQDEGVIYCVDTKAEVDKMYDYLKDNGVVAESVCCDFTVMQRRSLIPIEITRRT